MRILLSAFIFLSASYATAGHEVRNGGDVILCGDSHTPLSLDFVATQRLFPRHVQLVRVQSIDQSLRRIQRLVNQKLPTLGPSLAEFIQDVGNTTDDTRTYFWEEHLFDLYDIDDEKIQQLPYLCTRLGHQVFQAMIHTDHSDAATGKKRVVLKYNRNILDSLDPLQKSFLFVHEWLWSVAGDASVNRNINRYLHSELLASDTADEAAKRLLNFGFNVSRVQ